MNKYSTALAVLAMAALSAPVVCQAQDPAAEFKVVQQLTANGKAADALARCDKVLEVYGNPKSRVARQFTHFVPFFLWQKGQILMSTGDYNGAYETFKKLNTSEEYKKAELRDRAKLVVPGGYDAFLTASLFYMGYSLFQQGVGNEQTPGDSKKFEECIPVMEQYLQLYQSGKVSPLEKQQKLDGKLCFILLQAYILKEQPDFKKAGEYLEKSRNAKSSLPDDMAMTGLGTVINVAMKNPEYIDWGHKLLDANPSSFELSPVRMAAYGGKFFNYGNESSKLISDFLKAGKLDDAAAAARTTSNMLGLVPDTVETFYALSAMHKAIGDFKAPINDAAAGATYRADLCKALAKNYQKLHKDNTTLESYAISTAANAALQFGSNRLAKGGYQILLDRYPKMAMNGKDGLQSLRDKNYFQYAQLCRATGDEATAVKYEKMVNAEALGEGGQIALLINKMARLAGENRWEEAIPVAEEVVSSPEIDKLSQNYVAAKFTIVAGNYKLGQFDKVAKEGVALLDSGVIGQAKIKENIARNYDAQTRYFVIESYNKLGGVDPKNYDKAMEQVSAFIVKYPNTLDVKENPMLPNVYYMGIDTLLKRRGHGDDQADAKDLAKALEYCGVIAEKWPECALYPTSRLLAGNILINGDDESRKDEGVKALEASAEAALAQSDGKGKDVAANALFWLASYAPTIEREGESDADRAKRVQGYIDRFWTDADYEGNVYCLQMLHLSMKKAMESGSKEAFDKEVSRAESIIAREANLALENDTHNPDMEGAINSFVADYVDGYKQFNGKELTLEEKSEKFSNFPGISKDDKYTNAILRMALLSSMSDALAKAKRSKDGDPAEAARLDQEIKDAFGQLKKDFEPQQLTNFICVQVGNFAVNYAKDVPDEAARNADLAQAVSYFDTVLGRQTDNISEAKLGKANALSLMSDKAKQQEAVALYKELSSAVDPAILGPTLFGLTKVYMSMGDYASAVATASKFTANRSLNANRQEMYLLQGQAYAKSGNTEDALLTYTNLYNQNRGQIAFSAPACKAMMELYWERNKPSTGSRLKGDFRSSDRWRAWSIGQDYVSQIRKSGIEQQMRPDDRDKYNEVVKLLSQYGNDPAVQKEDKDKKNFEAKIRK